MDTSDSNPTLPWKNLRECEEFLKNLVDKNSHPIKRRQYLIQLQWLTNSSDDYRSQLFQTMLKCSKDEFLNNLNQHYNISFVLLNILLKSKSLNNDLMKLLNQLESSNSQDQNIFQMKIKELKRATQMNQPMNNISEILNSYYLLNNSKIEKQFHKYLKLHNQNDDECKDLLMNILIENESKFSEPTIGMILDQLEKFDYKLSNNSIYANRYLFTQRTDSSISQRLLLKQFLHSCDWSTILDCISDLLTMPSSPSHSNRTSNPSNQFHHRLIPTNSLKQSRFYFLNNRDSTLILDMLEAFIKLSPLWSGREFKMLERCHDEFLIDFNKQHIYTLIIYILDEGDRYLLSKKNLYEQYQKRYETILYYLIKSREKKRLFQECLQKILIDSETMLWMKDILTSFYFIIYLNQSDLFRENFYFILPNFFTEIKQQYKELNFINTNYDYIIHDLLIRLNSYDLISNENFFQINLLLKQYISNDPFLFLRYLNIIKLYLQSRLSTLTNEEFNRRISKQRNFFLSLFDFIYRLKPYIYDQIYQNDFQSIIDLYIRLIGTHLSPLNTCTKQNILSSNYLQDLIYLIDGLLDLIYHYLYSTINNNQHYALFKIYNSKFFEKIQEKIQMNKELYQVCMANKHNQIIYHLTQLKILYEAIKIDEITGKILQISQHGISSSAEIEMTLVYPSDSRFSEPGLD
jgi:hypothetical protein